MSEAACVVILRGGLVLGVTRKGTTNAWGLPAGKVHGLESPREAAARELREETGLSVDADQLTYLYERQEGDLRVVTYLSADPGGDLRPEPESKAGWVTWEQLFAGPFGDYNRRAYEALPAARLLAEAKTWILSWGSGTLRRAVEEDMAWRELYLEERTALEFGYGFHPAQQSRLTLGKALAEGDSPAVTETCWWARALRWRAGRDQRPATVRVVHARLSAADEVTEGIAITYEPHMRPAWLPADRTLVAFTTDPAGTSVNPC